MQYTIVPVTRLDFRFAPRSWPYAETNRAAVEGHFAAKKRQRPGMWNGRVLLAYEHAVTEGVSHGKYLEADFATFDTWRDWGCPPAGVLDCFSTVVMQSGDGAFLTGVMGPHTANAGQIYFPCGTPEPNDVVDGRVDLELNAWRELKEETGLDPHEFDPSPGWLAMIGRADVLHAKLIRSAQPAQELRRRVLDNLASQKRPELADVRIVREPADLDPKMPAFVEALLRHLWG